MIYAHEVSNRNLHPMMQAQFLMAAIAAEAGAEVTVCVTAPKVTDTPARTSPQEFLTLPGIAPDAQIGPMTVHRYVDNPENRRLNRVGQVYLKIRSITRANGLRPYGWTNLRPSQLTGFMILGIVTPEPEMATEALARSAQAPQGA